MKLVFSKNSNNEIELKIQKGTVLVDFTYTEMVRQLLEKNEFDETDYGALSAEEQQKINSMLDKISAVFKEVDEDEFLD
jgi:hypothetical protein